VFEILERWRWWIVVGAILGLLTGFGAYLVLPPRYQATTTILVEPQEVPKSYVESTVTLEIEQRLNTIQERVASHSNLTQLIELVGQKRLDPTGRLGTDELLWMIRSQLAVNIRARSEKTAPVFDIAFTHGDPAVAADVVRDVTGRFIEENLKDRAQQATATAEFLDVELQRLRDDVTKQEERIRQFRMERWAPCPRSWSQPALARPPERRAREQSGGAGAGPAARAAAPAAGKRRGGGRPAPLDASVLDAARRAAAGAARLHGRAPERAPAARKKWPASSRAEPQRRIPAHPLATSLPRSGADGSRQRTATAGLELDGRAARSRIREEIEQFRRASRRRAT
jgi:capsular polysaccharide biosynthesis protein